MAAGFAPALAAGVALAVLAVFQADRAAAAETSFLALWVTAALLPAAALAPPPGWETRLGAPLAVLAAFALPAGPARLAAVGALLVGLTAVAAGRALALAAGGRWAARPAPQGGLILPLALAAQVMLRSELLLAPDARAVALLIVLPVVGGLALGRLAALGGLRAALIAGAAAVTLGPGFTIVTTLALAGIAGGAELAARLAGLAVETRAAAAALAAGAVLAVAATPRAGTSRRRSALSVAAALSAALALPTVAWAVAVRSMADALALLAWLPLLVPALVPVLVLSPRLPSNRWPPLVAALGLGVAAALAVPGPAAVAAAAAVLAMLVAAPPGGAAIGEGCEPGAGEEDHRRLGSSQPRDGAHEAASFVPAAGEPAQNVPGAVPAIQALWSASLLAAAALVSSPPWLRPVPVDGALGLIGLEPGWLSAGAVPAVALGVAALSLVARAGSRAHRLARRPVHWAAGTLVLAALAALPAPGRPAYEGAAVVLDATRPRMAVELPGGPPPAAFAVYTHLSNGLGLPAGSEVATVSLLDRAGRTLARWPLRAGLDTGEWAVRRADVAAALPERATPPPWAAWVQAGGAPGAPEQPFFGQYYRALLELGGRPTAPPSPAPSAGSPSPEGAGNPGSRSTVPVAPAARLLVERAAGLPPEVLITIHRIEVTG